MKDHLLVLLGAAVGGAAGHFIFGWVLQQGFYGMIIPGGLLGLGAGLARCRSEAVAAACGILAVALGFFTEWRYLPFVADDSLTFFLNHINDLRPVTFIMVGIGGLLGFYIPYRRIPPV